MLMKKITGLFILLILFICSCNNEESQTNSSEEEKDYEGEYVSNEIPEGPVNINPDSTLFAPFDDEKIENGINSIYSIGIQLAWDAFKINAKGNTQPVEKNNWIEKLNKRSAEGLLSPESYVAVADKMPEAAIQINKELREKFNTEKEFNGAYQYLIYSFLFKSVKFKDPFEVDDFDFNNKSVYYLKTGTDSYHQVIAHYYAYEKDKIFREGDFIIELIPENSNDEIYIAKIKQPSSLTNGWQQIKTHLNKNYRYSTTIEDYDGKTKEAYFDFPHKFTYGDFFAMPAIDIMLNHSIPELEGIEIKNFDYTLDENSHVLFFHFDNKGLILIEEFEEASVEEAPIELTLPSLYCDEPFLIVLKEKNAKEPYFMMWVSNTKVMIPFVSNERNHY